MTQTYAGLISEYYYGDEDAAADFYSSAYENGPLGQTTGGYNTAVQASLGVVTVAVGGILIIEGGAVLGAIEGIQVPLSLPTLTFTYGVSATGVMTTTGVVAGTAITTITGTQIVVGAGAIGIVYMAIDPDTPAQDGLPGSLRREYPSEHLGKSLNEIKDALTNAAGKDKLSLQKAKKLIEQAERLLDKVKGK